MKKVILILGIIFSLSGWAGEEWKIELEQAKVLFDQKEYSRAKELLLSLAQAHPEDVEVNYYLGLSFLALDDFPSAKEWLSQAKKLAPENILIRLDLAWVLMNLGKLEPAEKELDFVKEQSPENARLWYLLGLLALNQQNCPEAEKYLKKAEQLDPKFKGEVGYYLGKCALLEGKNISAQKYFEEVIKSAPETIWAERAKKELEKIPSAKVFQASGDVLYQYDSNIVPVPDKDALPEEVSNMADSRALIWLNLGYYPLLKDQGGLGIKYCFYNNWQFEETELNLQVHQGELEGYYDFNISNLGARTYGSYLYQSAGLGKNYDYYSTTHRANLRFYLVETKTLTTEINYTFENEFFAHPGEEDFDRDNNAHQILLGEHIYLWNGRIDLGIFGRWRSEDAKGKNYDLNNYGASLLVQFLGWKNLSGWLSFDYDWRDFYRSDFDRQDEAYQLSLEIEYDFLKYLGVVAGFNYENYNSNLESYDYERQIYSLGIRAKY